jgi:hypothetical protein
MKARMMILALIGLAVAAAALLVFARPLVLLADRFVTTRVSALAAAPIGWDGNVLLVAGRVLNVQGPDYAAAAQLQVDGDGRLVLSAGGQSFTLGPRAAGSVAAGGFGAPGFAAEAGDTASLVMDRSWVAWPTPFDFNFMTGHSPSWRRAVYYRLVWTKPSGARLALLWRFEQPYYPADGWTADMTRDGWSGLVEVAINGPSAGR